MKRALLLVGAFWFFASPNTLFAQAVDTTVCDILAAPETFDGKIVRIKAVVIAGFEEFSVKGSGCGQPVDAIWLSYPEGTKGKAGPAALLRLQLAKNHPATVTEVNRTPVALDKNKDFKEFDGLLSAPAKASGLCLGCGRNTVTATLVGRIDSSKKTGFIRDQTGRVIGIGGFGNLNAYTARIVLQSVSDVSSQEIEYSKAGIASSGDRSFVPDTPTPDQIKRATNAFGAPGEDNGVSVGFAGANEIPKDDKLKSSASSPDGLLFDTRFDADRLKGPALEIAMSHVGTHIADLRSPVSSISSTTTYRAEFRAWQTSVLSAVSSKTKALTLPGGFLIYSQDWSASELGKNANDAISGFLGTWASISNSTKP